MQKTRQTLKVLLLIILVLLGSEAWASAEQMNNSVKECLENPDNCSEKELKNQPETKPETETKAVESTVGLTIWDFLRMIFTTLFVIGLLYVVLKFINKKSQTYKSSQLVDNIGGTNLGSNRSVQIIKVGNRLLVVGVGESIELLTEIDDPEEYRQILSEYNSRIEQLAGPSDIVTRLLERTRRKKTDGAGNSQFQSMLKRQLDEFKKGRTSLYEEMEKKGKDRK
ncbi:flagellar biosynthetic protein FliO [Bacillus sp. V33-4]|uniref:flagellar biosynthetic protein FliO n=1 Tax=Bacillus sp. V33-4 TaxID=2054169 RepID=UPI00215559E7|nr:flagellar biosynthetic protein FliO [Bacillus sp. V33-4]